MSLPNKISIFRILLAPVIVACLVYYHPSREWLRWTALGLFLLGMLTDALDGMIARLADQRTPLGTLLDPVADKLLILSALISCSVIHGLPESMRLPAWFNLIVISRDTILVAGGFILFMLQGRWTVSPNWLGKCTTAAQMCVVPTVLMGLPVKTPLIIIAAVLTALSTIAYIRTGIRVLG